MAEIHIERAVFPVVSTVTMEDVVFSHTYSASDATSFYDTEDAIIEFGSYVWFIMPGTLVLEANGSSLTEWRVSNVALSVSHYTNPSGTTPPATDDERYIDAFILTASSYDGTERVCRYSGANSVPSRAVSLLRVDGMTDYAYRKTGSSSNSETLRIYSSANSMIPQYTRGAVTVYRTVWEVEVWELINNVWTMTIDTIEKIVTVTGNNYFFKAVAVNAHDNQGSKSHDDITET